MPVNAADIRVLFVQSATEMGGAETALLQLTSRLRGHGVRPAVALLGFGAGPLAQRLREAGVEVIEFAGARFRNLPATGRTILRLAALIRSRAFHAVVANGGHPLLFARPAAMLAGAPCVWWSHNVMPADALRDGLIGVTEMLLGADGLVANSRQSAAALRRHFAGVPLNVIPPGIDTARYAAARQNRAEMRHALGLPESDFVVGVFGRLQFNKGQHTVIYAARELLRAAVPARILIVGATQFGLDAGYADRLRRAIQDLHLERCVTLLGQRDDVPQLLAACDVAIQPAVVPESYGLTVAEAMAAGVPVVASRHGGPLEIIDENVNGIFFAPGDAGELGARLLQLYRQPGLRRQLGAAAQAKALREFDVARTAQNFAAVLHNLAGARSNGMRPPTALSASRLEMQLEAHEQEAVSHALPK